MTYKLRVCPSDNDTGEAYEFFERFMDECGFRDTDDYGINFYLEKYRAKNVPNQPYIEFETEADATWFMLQWS